MHAFPAILAVAIGAIGWYYLFYSQAADRLRGVEEPAINRRRLRNRRAAGLLMMPMAALFLAGSYWVDAADRPGAFVLIWLGVVALLAAVLALAANDLRLTARLRRKELP